MNRLFLFPCLLLAVINLTAPYAVAGSDCWDALQLEPWVDFTHSHDATNMPNHSAGSGEHTHVGGQREITIGVCYAAEYRTVQEHTVVEPDPPPPVIRDYVGPILMHCVSEVACWEDDVRTKIIGPTDIDGNDPPLPEPGDPLIYYPIVREGDHFYWDSSRPAYQVSEEALNAEAPDGYRLEDINGELFLVPFDKASAVNTASEAGQTVLTFYEVYTLNNTDEKYLRPATFHVPSVDGPQNTDDPYTGDPGTGDPDPVLTPLVSSANDDQGTTDNQDNQEPTEGQGTTEGQDSLGGGSETYASLDGQFYQVTSNPPLPLQVTEYMIHTWGDGQAELPQWIEVYNPNTLAVNLVGYEFSYVFKKQTHSIELGHFLIPPARAIILATHIPLRRYRYEGISESQVYNLEIEFNALRQGWSLKDPLGGVISQIGKVFGEEENPIKPERVGISRVSQNVYYSERIFFRI